MSRNGKKKKSDKPPSRKHLKQEELSYLWHLENMDRANRAMQGTNDLEQVMKDVLDTLLSVFHCDRAWLVYPCDPEATTWQVLMERTTPEYPSILPIGVELPLEPSGAEVYRILRNSPGPVTFGPESEHPVPLEIAGAFSVQSFIAMAFYPKIGKPWSFGLHQCSYARVWTPKEERLFQEIGRRLSDTLSTLLAYRNLEESRRQIKQLIDASPVAMIVSSGIEQRVESVNDKFIELFGYTIEDMPDVGHWWPLAYPDEKYRVEIRSQWQTKVEQAIRDKDQIEPMEATVVCKDGSHRHVEFRLSSIGEKNLVTFVDLTERKQAEDELRQNREATLQFSEQLAALQEVTNELSKAESSDDLCLQAVQLGRSRLGFDRVSIWFIEDHLGIMRGSFGTDERGELRDERNAQVEFRHEGLSWLLFSHKESMALVEHCPLCDHLGREVGEGDNALAALWDGDEVIGVISVDNLFTGQPIREHQLEVLRLYATTLGHLITRKRAEDKLVVREREYRALVENTPDLIVRYDTNLRRIYVNPAWERASGLSAEDVVNVPYTDIPGVPSPVNDEYLEKLQQALTFGTTQAIEFTWVNAHGGTLFLEYVIVPEYDRYGKISGVLSVGHDITARKKAEVQLLASEQLFRALVENSPDFIARYDRECRRIYVNPAIQKLFGTPPENMLGKTPADQSPVYTPQVYMDHLKRVIETGTESVTEMPFRTAQGEMHWSHMRFVPEFGPEGQVESVLHIGRDIHEIKENERRFRMLAENFPDLVMRFDREGRYIYVNPAFEKAVGMPAESIIGKTLQELPQRSKTEQNKARLALIRRALDEGIANESEVRWDTERGERIFEDRYVPERDATGNVVTVLCIARDVTEQKRAEEDLQKTNALLRAIIEAAPTAIIGLDLEGKVQNVWNPAAEKMLGWSAEEAMGKFLPSVSVDKEEEFQKFRQWVRSGKSMNGVEVQRRRRDGTSIDYSIYASPLRDSDGNITGNIAVLVDITERKQMIEALAAREREFRTLAEYSPDNIARYDINCRTLYINPALEKTLGRAASEMLGTTPIEAGLIDEAEKYQEKIAEVLETGKEDEMDLVLPDRGEGVRYHNIRFVAERGADGAIIGVQTIGRDITERKRAEDQRKNHLHFLESMDKVNRAMQSTSDLNQIMNDVLDIVLSVFDCDRAFLLYPCDPDASSWNAPTERTRPEYPGVLALGIKEMPMDAEDARTFRILLDTDGPVRFGPGSPNPLPAVVSEKFSIKSFMSMALYPKVDKPWQFGVHQCSYARIWTPEDERLFQAIGQRLSDVLTVLLTHRHLRESEERYRQLVNLSPEAIAIFSQGRIVFANPAAVRIVGAKSEEDLLGRSILDFVHPDFRESVMEQVERLVTGISTPFIEEKFLRLDGLTVDVEVAVVSYQRDGVVSMQIVARDITERKRHEREREAIITVSTALRRATTRTDILNVILDQVIDLFKADGSVLVLPHSQTEGFIDEMGRGSVGERMIGLNIPPERGVANWVIKNKKPYLNNRADDDPLFYRPDLLGDSHCLVCVPLIAQEQAIGALWIARRTDIMEQELRLLNAIADIAANAIHRVMLHDQTVQQLHHLLALHQIDLSISANFDLNVTLKVIMQNVKDELEVDASSILLLDPVTHTLDYAAGIGFRTRNIEGSHVKLGHGYAGRAAQERCTTSGPDLKQTSETFSRSALLANEGFLSHYATPLIVKGQVKGVLEIFHREPFVSDKEWIDYFETLATQAAIAIENASLLENLQRSNMELTLAYDATIEGWSRALDLRDRETEGHTQRVTEMVLSLAEKMGMSDAEKLDLRRGALLHDIGKMGVPDSILLKPGSLSEREWKIMRQHPFYAFQMLSPIPYLKHALDIPYCHHERWDGSGYPRGLRGEEIPLSARLFAVVDVFDALTSDRPYRAAWPREEVHRYIQEQAGRHFDPRVVKIFLDGT